MYLDSLNQKPVASWYKKVHVNVLACELLVTSQLSTEIYNWIYDLVVIQHIKYDEIDAVYSKIYNLAICGQ